MRPAWTPLTTLVALLAVAAVLSADCGLETRSIEICGPATRFDPNGPRLLGARLSRLARDLAASRSIVAEHRNAKIDLRLAAASSSDWPVADRIHRATRPDLRPEWLNLPPPISG